MPRPLVLLHPFPVDARFWDPLRAELGNAWDVTAPEAPGFGAAPPEPGWSVADWADAVAGRIAAGPDPAVVVGLSMGGYAALALAARHPDMLAGLVLADTRAEADTDEARAARMAAVARIEADGGTAGYLADALPRLLAPGAAPAVRAALGRIAAAQPAETVTGALRALAARPDRRAGLAAVRVPTVVVVGEEDGVTPVDAARVLHEGIPGSRLVVIPGAGHMSALEDPAAVAAAIGLLA